MTNKRKTRVELTLAQKKEVVLKYSTHDALSSSQKLNKLAKQYNVSKSTIGRIVGVYKKPVYKPEYNLYRPRKRTRKLSNGFSQLQSYLDGLREGIVVRVAETPEAKTKLSRYINGWDDCADTILRKLKDFV